MFFVFIMSACSNRDSHNEEVPEAPLIEEPVGADSDFTVENMEMEDVLYRREFYVFDGGYKVKSVVRAETSLFFHGAKGDEQILGIAQYTLGTDGEVSLGETRVVALPMPEADFEKMIYGICAGADSCFYVLTGELPPEYTLGGQYYTNPEYQGQFDIIKYSKTGEFLNEELVTLPTFSYIQGIFVDVAGRIILYGDNTVLCIEDGKAVNEASIGENSYIQSASLCGDTIVLQAYCDSASMVKNFSYDPAKGMIREFAIHNKDHTPYTAGIDSASICQGLDNEYIVCQDSRFYSCTLSDLVLEELFRWNYGVSYQQCPYVCRLADKSFICSVIGEEYLLATGLVQRPKMERSIVNVALYDMDESGIRNSLRLLNASQNRYEYTVNIYTHEGSLTASLPVAVDNGDSAKSLLVLSDGSFWLRGLHSIRHYSADGSEMSGFSESGKDIGPVIEVNGEAIFQTTDYQNSKSQLNRFDSDEQKLIPIENGCALSAPTAICQSAVGVPLISMGDSLIAVTDDYEAQEMVNWNELLGTTTLYRYICQLGEDTFLLVEQNIDEMYYQMQGIECGASGELICVAKSYVPDNRSSVRIAFYGQASEMLGVLESQYAHYSPDYRVECLDYGSDKAGLERLTRDAATADKIDIIVCDGYSIDTTAGFVDLYPFIDNDQILSREDFVPQVLSGIERNGELHEIWSCFSINALEAFGQLSEGPTPLRLVDCQAYLDSIGYTEPMFSAWMTKTELLKCICPGMLKSAYDPGSNSYNLDNGDIRALLELCSTRPAEVDGENEYFSEVLGYTDLQPDYFNNLITSGRAFRLFDGSNGDNFTSFVCDYRSGYMIPETCPDKENAWGFLRILLMEEQQLKEYNQRRMCYPSNINALEQVLDSYDSPETYEAVHRLIEDAVLYTPDYVKAEQIFIESVQPYLYGDAELDEVLGIAQGKLNIFSAERKS